MSDVIRELMGAHGFRTAHNVHGCGSSSSIEMVQRFSNMLGLVEQVCTDPWKRTSKSKWSAYSRLNVPG